MNEFRLNSESGDSIEKEIVPPPPVRPEEVDPKKPMKNGKPNPKRKRPIRLQPEDMEPPKPKTL